MTKGDDVSYSDPPPPPPQYGAPQPAYGGMPPKRSGMAVAGLVLGILAVIPCFWSCLVFAVLAIIFGQLGKKDIREAEGGKTGEGMAKWAVILGVVGLVLGVAYWILVAADVINVNYTSDVG
jgi:hypothetical protein